MSLPLLIVLLAATADDVTVGRLNFHALRVGEIGTFSSAVHAISGGRDTYNTYRVLQVLDEESLLLQVRTTTMVRPFATAETIAGGTSSTSFATVLLKMRTSKLADDTAIAPLGAWEVTGTHRYTTLLGGQRTVYKLQQTEKARDRYEKAKEAARREVGRRREAADKRIAAKEQFEWEAEFELGSRLWKAASGKHSLHAIYDGFEPGYVWLRKEDKTRLRVKLSDLHADCRRYAVDRARKDGELDR